MAIASYTDLQTAIQNWLNRADAQTIARIPEFIDLAEKRIQRKQEWFQELYSLAIGAPLNVTASPTQLPNFIRRVLNIFNVVNGSNDFRPLTLVPLEQLRDLMQTNLNATGTPTAASIVAMSSDQPQVTPGGLTIDLDTITNDQSVFSHAADLTLGPLFLFLWPPPAGTAVPPVAVDIEYVRKLPPLSLYGTNALLVEHPDIYLYATLLESAPYLQHDDRIPMWNDEYERRVREIDIERERTKFGATPRRMRLPYVF